MHDLRAFCTTQLIEAGVPIDVVADQLGHADIATTFRIYRRVNTAQGRQVAAAMTKALEGITT